MEGSENRKTFNSRRVKEGGIERSGGRPSAGRMLMKAGEARAELGVGRTKFYRMAASGALPVVRIGRSVRVSRAALEAWIRAQSCK